MVEFLVGLVGVAVLAAMLVQINLISAGSRDPDNPVLGHTRMVIEQRNTMARMLAENTGSAFDAEYISTWDPGPDDHENTVDDVSVSGNSGLFLNTMDAAVGISGSSAGGMGLMELLTLDGQRFPENSFMRFSGGSSGQMGDAFGIFRVVGQTSISNELAVQKLVGASESLLLEHEIYMPQINGIDGASGVELY